MKRMLKYIIASSLLLMFSGCNDWLDVQPKSEIRSDIQFETEGGFKDALIGGLSGIDRRCPVCQRSDLAFC